MLDMFDIYLPIAEMQFNALILVAIGFSVGVLGGFFGVGGAWVVTPALNIFGFPMAYAIGTDLAHIFGKSIVATAKHRKMGNVDMKLGLHVHRGLGHRRGDRRPERHVADQAGHSRPGGALFIYVPAVRAGHLHAL